MTETRPLDPPSPFVAEWASTLVHRLPHPRLALDVAAGRGRHAVPLAKLGYTVFGVDRNLEAIRDARAIAARAQVRLHVWCADLTQAPLPENRFALVVVARYLQRDLFASLSAALVGGGVLLYETFTEAQRAHGRGPTSPEHLLAAGELRERAIDCGLAVDFYEECVGPDAVARLVARKASSAS